jgi:exodeoxyribonuclease-3
MKIISWNVNGIRAVLQKGFSAAVKKENPEILCLQEIKAHPEQVDRLLEDYPHHLWNPAEKKGYSGTAIFSKIKPLSVKYGRELLDDKEGRVILAEFKEFYLINVYTPNSGRGLSRLRYRQQWDEKFLKMAEGLEKKKKPIVICGDLNVAHTAIDLANPKENYDKTAGYTQEEIDGLEKMLKHGRLTDTFRKFHSEAGNYTYWSYMFNARKKNIGWRIDYFLASEKIINKVKSAFILPEVMGSDHCPVGIEIKRI